VNRLVSKLKRIDRAGCPACKTAKGSYDYPGFVLRIEPIRGDQNPSPNSFIVNTHGGFGNALGHRILAKECIEMFTVGLPIIATRVFDRDNPGYWKPLRKICGLLEKEVVTSPLSDDIPIPHGDRVHVRYFEITAAVTRLRTVPFT